MRTLRRIGGGLLGALALALAGCGGGGAGGGGTSGGGGMIAGPPADPVYMAGKWDPPSTFANYCAAPRSGTDPVSGKKYPDTLGSIVWENHWIRAWSQAYYLWYGELPDLDPAAYTTTLSYFDKMKTPALSPTGTKKDKFHFTYDTAQWESFATAGAQLGYGANWAFVAVTPPRKLFLAYTDPGSPATTANLARGASVLQIDGVDLVNANTQADVDKLNAALSPSRLGERHSFTVLDLNGSQRTVTMAAANVTSTPVQNVVALPVAGGSVGYIQFNDHIATAEAGLITAINTLGTAGVRDLVLDMRYNGGGYLDIASETAFMIAGTARTAGRTFEKLSFNAKYPTTDPITGMTITPTPFYSTTRFGSSGTTLPSLNLRRVIIITGGGTCSASESVINSLNGIGLTVVLIGGQTCGKPYGFYPEDNCGTTYFSIQFKGVNDVGFGDYTDGFVPENAPSANGAVTLPGCAVADDFTHALGDPTEGRLAAALQYAATSTCPTATALAAPALEAKVMKPVWLMNRILRRPH
jgi:C-terminal processing protease CtpA/Prc